MTQNPKTQTKPSTSNPKPDPTRVPIRHCQSQITQLVGFKSMKPSTLETLTHISVVASASYATMAKRTNTNVFDFANALHDLVRDVESGNPIRQANFASGELGAEKRGNEVPFRQNWIPVGACTC
ncbi:hypothetical protein ACFX13_026135 [Malus domestica]